MTREQLKKFIQDTRGLIKGASPEKKVKLLQLIKEAKRKCDDNDLAMELDEEKVGGVLDSKYAVAALAGALKATGADVTQNDEISVNGETQDYLEEK